MMREFPKMAVSIMRELAHRLELTNQQLRAALSELRELRETVAQSEVFAVGSRVLPDQCDFPRAGLRQVLRFAHHRFKPSAAKRAAKLRNNAERARMIAAFRDFDIRCVFWRRDDARRQVVIQKRRRLRGKHAKIAFHRRYSSAGSASPADVQSRRHDASWRRASRWLTM